MASRTRRALPTPQTLALAGALTLWAAGADAQRAPAPTLANPSQVFSALDALIADVATNPDYTDEAAVTLQAQIEDAYGAFVQPNPVDVTFGQWPTEMDPTLPAAPLRLEQIWLVDSFSQEIVESTCPPDAPCEFPDVWDIKAFRIYTVWRIGTRANVAEIEESFAGQNGRGVRLWLEGQELDQAFGGTFAPGDYHAYLPLAKDVVVIVFRPHAWYPAAPPWPAWNIYLQLTKPNGIPIVGFDANGSPVVYGKGSSPASHRSATVVPKPELESFWTATIGESVTSGRCTTCHSMDTPEKIRQRHNGLIDQIAIFETPSILVPGKTVWSCNNCHESNLPYLGESSPFEEGKWATPTQGMDIHWAQIVNDHPLDWPHEICSRMVANMPTHALRAKHFHEDARLFWAVEKGELPDPTLPDLPTAPPHDHDEFLRRFDVWNDSGAHCPPSVADAGSTGGWAAFDHDDFPAIQTANQR